MKSFEFEKWYFDFLTEDDCFLFGYAATVRILGVTTREFKYYLIEPLASSDKWQTFFKENGINLVYRVGESDFLTVHTRPEYTSLRHQPVVVDGQVRQEALPGAVFKVFHKKQFLAWNPVAIQALVSIDPVGQQSINKPQIVNGYVDYVYSTIFPLKTPITQLYWGRVHMNDFSLTYTCTYHNREWINQVSCKLQATRDRQYLKDTQHPPNAQHPAPSTQNLECTFHTRPDDYVYDASTGLTYPGSFSLVGKSDKLRIELEIKQIHTYWNQEFMEEEGKRPGIQRRLYNWLGRRPRGVKYLLAARCKVQGSGFKAQGSEGVVLVGEFEAKGIGEYVEFG